MTGRKESIIWGFEVSTIILLISAMFSLVNRIENIISAPTTGIFSILNRVVAILAVWAILAIFFAFMRSIIRMEIEQFLKWYFGLEVISTKASEKREAR